MNHLLHETKHLYNNYLKKKLIYELKLDYER